MSEDQPADTRIRTRSAERREREKAELRRTILDAAGELFVQEGYESFSLRRLAETIGYTPTTLYLYFANKDALLLEVLHEGFQEFGQGLQAAYASTADPLERLEALGRAYIAFGLKHPAYYRLMFLERPEFLIMPDAERGESTIDSFGVLFQAVGEAAASGRLGQQDPEVLAQTLWAGVHGIVSLAVATPVCNEVRAWEMADIYLPAIKRGLSSSEGEKS